MEASTILPYFLCSLKAYNCLVQKVFSDCLFDCLSTMSIFVCLFVRVSVSVSDCLSVCLTVYLSVSCPSVGVSDCLIACPSVCFSVCLLRSFFIIVMNTISIFNNQIGRDEHKAIKEDYTTGRKTLMERSETKSKFIGNSRRNSNTEQSIHLLEIPSHSPSSSPNQSPIFSPIVIPSESPTLAPTRRPRPTSSPTKLLNPSLLPTQLPSKHYIVSHCTVSHCTVSHCTVSHCTVSHCTVVYCTAPYLILQMTISGNCDTVNPTMPCFITSTVIQDNLMHLRLLIHAHETPSALR